MSATEKRTFSLPAEQAAFREMFRVLRPGGSVVINVAALAILVVRDDGLHVGRGALLVHRDRLRAHFAICDHIELLQLNDVSKPSSPNRAKATCCPSS